MKPIGQTFFVNKSRAGVAGVYITQIDVYFKSISNSKSITLELRETDNGFPTPTVIPNSAVTAFPASIPVANTGAGHEQQIYAVNRVYASDDASIPTEFVFNQPAYLEANKSYAFVLIPGGGTDEYEVWTSEIGQTDVGTNTLVTKNNESGTLFISSNDIQWTPVQTEDIKFKIYQAQFTQSSGEAILSVANTDQFIFKDYSGNFTVAELAYITSGIYEITKMNASSITGTFTNNELIFQSNGTANVAFGNLIFSNSTVIVVANTKGAFTNSYQIKGSSSSANAVITSVVDDSTFTSGSNTITVPFANVYAVNTYIWVASNDRSQADFKEITAITSSNTIRVDSNFSFTESSGAIIAKYNPAIQSGVFFRQENKSEQVGEIGFLRNINSTNNYINAENQYLIGRMSLSSAKVTKIEEMKYNAISPHFLTFSPKDTDVSFSFKGIEDDGNYTTDDASYITIKNDRSNELIDKQRVLIGISREATERAGAANSSFRVKADLISGNNEISPVVDMMGKYVTFTQNIICNEDNLEGYYITLSKSLDNRDLVPAIGSTVTFGSNTAEVAFANTTFVRAINSSGELSIGSMTFDTFTANAVSVEYYSESLDNGHSDVARYISKNVILAPDQDADDAITYLTAYRPTNTNIQVYIKAQGVNDTSLFENRVWSKMIETGTSGLLSSKANPDDFIELKYDLPLSQGLFADSANCTSTSVNVNMFNTETLSVGDYLYIKDNANSTFTIREIMSITNSSSVAVSSNVGFTSTNAAVGIIPNLQNENGMFKYHLNDNISRYVNSSGDFHDTFKTFAIKIVLTSNNLYTIPRVADMRTLALQN